MRILVVNDDGIEAAGIIRLAALAKEFGEDSGILNNMLFEDSLHPKLGVNKDGSSILDYRN